MNKRGYICFVWDDGFLTDKTVALQEQLDRGISPKGTSFLVGSTVIGSSLDRLHVSDCLEMLDAGWDFEDHTYTHPVGTTQFADLTGDEMREQLQESNDFFTDVLHTAKPDHWSIPGGTLTKKILDIVGRERKTIMVGGSRYITSLTNGLMLPSFDMSPTYQYTSNLDTGGVRKNTIRKVIDDVVKYGYGAVLFGHDMTNADEVDAYTDALDYSLASGAQLVTLSEMYEIFNWRKNDIPVK